MKKYENLSYLLEVYFNQDFPDMTGTVENTVREFAKELDENDLLDTLLEIQDVYSKYSNKEEVTSFLNNYFKYSYYNFLYDFPDGMAWLEYVECIIKEELAKRVE